MPRTAEVVVAGHICLDFIPAFPQEAAGPIANLIVPGGLVEMDAAVVATGGVVSNTGLALHRLGAPTALMGKVGGDELGRTTLDIVRAEGEGLADGMIVSEGESSSYSVVIEPPGTDRCFLHHPGPNDTYRADDINYDALEGVRIFHFGYPTIMGAMRADQGAELRRMFEAVKARGITTSMDMSTPDPESASGRVDWAALLENVLPFVDLFLPSLPEILFMLDRTRFDAMRAQLGSPEITSLADGALLNEVAGKLIDLGVAVAGLKIGDQGLYLRTTDDDARLANAGAGIPADRAPWVGREMLSPCFEAKVVGATGAGDSCIAGFLASLARGNTPEQAVTDAVATGSFCVEHAAAVSNIPTYDALRKRIDAGWAREATALPLPGWQLDEQTGLRLGPGERG